MLYPEQEQVGSLNLRRRTPLTLPTANSTSLVILLNPQFLLSLNFNASWPLLGDHVTVCRADDRQCPRSPQHRKRSRESKLAYDNVWRLLLPPRLIHWRAPPVSTHSASSNPTPSLCDTWKRCAVPDRNLNFSQKSFLLCLISTRREKICKDNNYDWSPRKKTSVQTLRAKFLQIEARRCANMSAVFWRVTCRVQTARNDEEKWSRVCRENLARRSATFCVVCDSLASREHSFLVCLWQPNTPLIWRPQSVNCSDFFFKHLFTSKCKLESHVLIKTVFALKWTVNSAGVCSSNGATSYIPFPEAIWIQMQQSEFSKHCPAPWNIGNRLKFHDFAISMS